MTPDALFHVRRSRPDGHALFTVVHADQPDLALMVLDAASLWALHEAIAEAVDRRPALPFPFVLQVCDEAATVLDTIHPVAS